MGHRKKMSAFFCLFSSVFPHSYSFQGHSLAHHKHTRGVLITQKHLGILQLPRPWSHLIPVCYHAFHSWFPIAICVATASYRRQGYIFCFPSWSCYYHRLPKPWSRLITILWSHFPLVNSNRNLYGYRLLLGSETLCSKIRVLCFWVSPKKT